MEPIDLREHAPAKEAVLSPSQRDALIALDAGLTITSVPGKTDAYFLKASSTIGAVRVQDLALTIKPKLDISRVLFLLTYAFDPKHWREDIFKFGEEDDLYEAVLPGYVANLEKSLRRGVLQGYVTREEALSTVRGRIRFDDQIKQRQGLFPPIEVRYDDFTQDIQENRLLAAAIGRLRSIGVKSLLMRRKLAQLRQALAEITEVEFDPANVPNIVYTPLNEHYRPAVELSKLILRTRSWDQKHGEITTSAFLVNMNKVFEDFVVAALREALGVDAREFPQGARAKMLRLDEMDRVALEPDVSWWQGKTCLFVGDVKYKKTTAEGILHPDLYQLLSYCIATDLPAGMLIYAGGEGVTNTTHSVVHAGKKLEIRVLDLSMSPDGILRQIRSIAQRVKELSKQSLPAA